MLKVFNRPTFQAELDVLLERNPTTTTLLEGVNYDRMNDAWCPDSFCTQGSLPIQPSEADRKVFLSRALHDDILRDESGIVVYRTNGMIHGRDLKPDLLANCPECQTQFTMANYFDTNGRVLQQSNIGRKQHAIFALSCSFCPCIIPYDPNVDRLHCFGKTGVTWHAGEGCFFLRLPHGFNSFLVWICRWMGAFVFLG
jgi:hypothetical protein